MSNFAYWMGEFNWSASASDILNEEVSEGSGQSTDSVYWIPTDFLWRHSASEILNQEALESGQSTDDF